MDSAGGRARAWGAGRGGKHGVRGILLGFAAEKQASLAVFGSTLCLGPAELPAREATGACDAQKVKPDFILEFSFSTSLSDLPHPQRASLSRDLSCTHFFELTTGDGCTNSSPSVRYDGPGVTVTWVPAEQTSSDNSPKRTCSSSDGGIGIGKSRTVKATVSRTTRRHSCNNKNTPLKEHPLSSKLRARVAFAAPAPAAGAAAEAASPPSGPCALVLKPL